MHEIQTVPSYPVFRKMDIHADRLWYESFYSQFPIYADLSFGNLFLWLNLNDDLQISNLNGNLIFRYTNPFKDNQPGISLLGTHVTNEDIHILFADLLSQNMPPRLFEIPEVVVEQLGADRFQIIEDRDSFEYLLSTQEHSELPGKAFSRLRRKVGYFRRLHEPAEITWKIYDDLTPELHHLLESLIDEWGLTAESSDEYPNYEGIVLPHSLQLFNTLGMNLLVVYVDEVPISFAIYRKLPQGAYVTVNHLKVNYNIQYAFDFTTHVLATELLCRGIHTMNFEQDLGIPGLRDHKERLRPIEMLKKYTVESGIIRLTADDTKSDPSTLAAQQPADPIG